MRFLHRKLWNMFEKKMKKTLIREEIFCVYGLENSACKDVICPSWLIDLMQFQPKSQSFSVYVKIDKHIIKFMWNCKGIFLLKEQWSWRTYYFCIYKVTLIKIVWCWCNDRRNEYLCRRANPERDLNVFNHIWTNKAFHCL